MLEEARYALGDFHHQVSFIMLSQGIVTGLTGNKQEAIEIGKRSIDYAV